ncbi:Integral membrane protein SED5 [Coemansia javaensis]|uniref:Integral membrane protein SED5 n=1 Tax=Coemansia javaensis TaxID=2761396 RepID=A0A9W8LDL2_9FUNG|nr:Integral membrane protein SED5 [Coemansia javaensis]
MSHAKPKTLRDRTSEYKSLVTALRKRQQAPPPAELRAARSPEPSFGEFSKQAAAIGSEIQSTALLLEQLATLARAKTIFDDRTSEINALTGQVKQRIAAINNKILSLQQIQRMRRGTGQQASEHHSNVVLSLQSRLASTSTAFKDVLELRSESLRESGTRKEQFIGAAAATAGTLSFSPADSPLYRAERQAPRPAVPGPASEGEDFVALSLPSMDEASGSQMLLARPGQSAYLDSRSEAITSIESTISELGSIFQQLAHMVSEQREVVQRIDANVESVDINISAAHTELLRYYANISSNRWLMVKVFAVIIVFVFLLITFV